MRHLSRQKAEAPRLLDRARTIALVGWPTNERSRTTAAYLRRVGYDVVAARSAALTGVPRVIDLVLVFRTPADVPSLLRSAAARGADGVWFTEAGPDRAAMALARQLRLGIAVDSDVIDRHAERISKAGAPEKLAVRPRRRRRQDPTDGRLSSRTGWEQAGGGGRRGGGGGRAVIDEKKMIGRRPSRRRAVSRHRAA